MSFNPVLQLLSLGLSEEQIVNQMMKQSPKIAKKIQQMMLGGYGVSQITEYLTKDKDAQKQKFKGKPESPREIASYSILQSKVGVDQGQEEKAKQGLKKLTGILAGAGAAAVPLLRGGAMLQQGMDMASQALMPSGQIGESIQQGLGGEPQQEAAPQPVQPTMAISEQITQLPNIDNLPPTVRDQLRFLHMTAKQLEKEGKDPNDPALQNIFQKAEKLAKKSPTITDEEIDRFEQGYGEEVQQPEITNLKPQEARKGVTVLTPDGLGEIVDIAKKNMLVKDGNKVFQVSKDKAFTLPLPEKELSDLYDDLIRGQEKETKQDVSRNVYFAGYDPEKKELLYIPHSGGAYIYDDIDEETSKELTSMMTQRKTTGQNYIGAWEEGTDSPIGASMSKLILGLQKQRGGKGSEYRNKFATIYDALEPSKLALKEKKKREKRKSKKAKKPGIA